MDPALALPSYRVYRGSLLALLVGSIVPGWLLVLPPASADQDGPPDSIAGLVNTRTATPEVTPTPEPTEVGGTPEATPTAAPTDVGGMPEATPTSEATEMPSPTPTATPEAQEQTYIVQAGDTMFLIADQFAPAGVAAADFANTIAQANGITDISSLQVGQELIIPNE